MIVALILGGIYICFSVLFAAYTVIVAGEWDECVTPWDYTQRVLAFLFIMVAWFFVLPMIIETLVEYK